MRSNSGKGKSNNNLLDPTLKEHERVRDKLGGTPTHSRSKSAADSDPDQRQRIEAGPVD